MAVLAAVVEEETNRFIETRIGRIAVELEAFTFVQRCARRRELISSLESFLDSKRAELIAQWWNDIGGPADDYFVAAARNFFEQTRALLGNSGASAPACIEQPAIEPVRIEDLMPSAGIEEHLQAPRPFLPIFVSWFRRRLVRRATQELRTGTGVIDIIERALVIKFRNRTDNFHKLLERQADEFVRSKSGRSQSHVRPVDMEDGRASQLPVAECNAIYPEAMSQSDFVIQCSGDALQAQFAGDRSRLVAVCEQFARDGRTGAMTPGNELLLAFIAEMGTSQLTRDGNAFEDDADAMVRVFEQRADIWGEEAMLSNVANETTIAAA